MSDEEEISVYDEVEIEDMTYDEALQTYFYPCPCGDRFQIALADLQDEETDIAVCPSCSLMIRVIYEVVSLSRPHCPTYQPTRAWGVGASRSPEGRTKKRKGRGGRRENHSWGWFAWHVDTVDGLADVVRARAHRITSPSPTTPSPSPRRPRRSPLPPERRRATAVR